MTKVMEQVEVSKESRELGQAVVGLTRSIRKALRDGFQITDVAEIVKEEFSAMIVGVQGVENMPAEAKEDAAVFARTIGLTGGEIAGVFLEKLPAEKPSEAPAAPSV